MPRPKKEGAREPLKRSRHGCWPCKGKKIKCGEEKPRCLNCERQGEQCDYSIRLNWDGRSKKKNGEGTIWSMEHLTPNTAATDSSRPSPRPPSSANSPEKKPSPYGSPVYNAATVANHQHFLEPPAWSDHYQKQRSSPTPGQIEPALQQAQQMLPPRSSPVPRYQSPSYGSTIEPPVQHGIKRKRSPAPPPTQATYTSDGIRDPYAGFNNPQERFQPQNTQKWQYPSYDQGPTLPLTPFSGNSEDGHNRSQVRTPPSQQTSPDLRRLSVKSLLSNPDDDIDSRYFKPLPTPDQQTMYGFDHGRPDLDIPQNDDTHALSPPSPSNSSRSNPSNTPGDDPQNEFGFGLKKDVHFEGRGYYAEPVPVRIPSSLEPLPQLLQESPMNLLYFHHFLNHTARILVPHDCPENPFRNILPQMAVHNVNLLNLLLAYAASHRARLLNHKDPANRIALLVRDVFPNLRHALDDNRDHISEANLATSIMLASMEIVSPNAFEVPVSWQTHLTIARQIIVARGGYAALHRKDKASYFLSRWFAYLDVLGSLSGGNYDRPLLYSSVSDDDDLRSTTSGSSTDDEGEIDCLLGFTSKCITTLAKIADLAKQCDSQRIGLGGVVRGDWTPSPDIAAQAEKLKNTLLNDPRPTTFRGCTHRRASDAGAQSAPDDEAQEMVALNDTYHAAGLIHLYRRVLGMGSDSAEVRAAVAEIEGTLDKVRRGGTAEACMIFPMFTAGCEALYPDQRARILERLRIVESYGMTQVRNARALMERVWETGKPWETLVTGEFVG